MLTVRDKDLGFHVAQIIKVSQDLPSFLGVQMRFPDDIQVSVGFFIIGSKLFQASWMLLMVWVRYDFIIVDGHTIVAAHVVITVEEELIPGPHPIMTTFMFSKDSQFHTFLPDMLKASIECAILFF